MHSAHLVHGGPSMKLAITVCIIWCSDTIRNRRLSFFGHLTRLTLAGSSPGSPGLHFVTSMEAGDRGWAKTGPHRSWLRLTIDKKT